jgi:hypothetical protein
LRLALQTAHEGRMMEERMNNLIQRLVLWILAILFFGTGVCLTLASLGIGILRGAPVPHYALLYPYAGAVGIYLGSMMMPRKDGE